MSKIRGTNTKPELIVKNMMDGRIFRYQPKGIPGKPDFGNKRRRIAVFVDGCFWHKCPKCYSEPKSNRKFWTEKIERNVKRDRIINSGLRKNGWVVLRIWEHSIKRKPKLVIGRINRTVSNVR